MSKIEVPIKYINNLENRARFKLIKRYDKPLSYHDVKMINDILYNEKTRYVEAFKEYLIYEDYNEFLKRYYRTFELKIKLPKILIFYEKYSKIYANYTVIPESKYMYKNIKRKQKMIDQMQNIDINNTDNEEEEEENEDMSNTVFSSRVMNSIYNKTLSSLNRSNNNDGNSEQSINNFISKISNIENNINNAIKINMQNGGKNSKKYQKNIILPFKINKNILTNNTTYNKHNQKNRIQINKNEFLNNRINNNSKSKNLDVQFTYSKKSFLNELSTNNENNNNINSNPNMNSNANKMAFIKEYMSKNNNSIFNLNNSIHNNTNNSNTFHRHKNSLQINNFSKHKIRQNVLNNINNIKENMSESNINNYFSKEENNLRNNSKYKLSLGETLLKKEKIVLSTNTSGSNMIRDKLFSSNNSRDNILVTKKKLLLKEKLIEKGYLNQEINSKLNQKKIKPNLLVDYNSPRNTNYNILENQNITNINNNLNKLNNKKKSIKKIKYENKINNNQLNKEKDKDKNKEQYAYSEIQSKIKIKKPESHRNYNYNHTKILSNNIKNKIMSNTNKAFKITVGLKQDLSQNSKKSVTTRCSPNSSSSNFYYNSHNNKISKKVKEKNLKNTLDELNKKKVVNYNIINNIQDNSTQINIYAGSDLYKSLHFHNNSVFNSPNITPSGGTSRSPLGGVKTKKNFQQSNYFKSQINRKEKNRFNLNLKKMIHRRILDSDREKGLISERLMTHNKLLEKLERYFLKSNIDRDINNTNIKINNFNSNNNNKNKIINQNLNINNKHYKNNTNKNNILYNNYTKNVNTGHNKFITKIISKNNNNNNSNNIPLKNKTNNNTPLKRNYNIYLNDNNRKFKNMCLSPQNNEQFRKVTKAGNKPKINYNSLLNNLNDINSIGIYDNNKLLINSERNRNNKILFK